MTWSKDKNVNSGIIFLSVVYKYKDRHLITFSTDSVFSFIFWALLSAIVKSFSHIFVKCFIDSWWQINFITCFFLFFYAFTWYHGADSCLYKIISGCFLQIGRHRQSRQLGQPIILLIHVLLKYPMIKIKIIKIFV